MHRGTTLLYGKVSEEGIACCYHGWLFDVEGRCLASPASPKAAQSRVARQPWYPVEDHYGLVFAYMGPLEKKPALPRFDILEDLGPMRKSAPTWARSAQPATTAFPSRPTAGST